VPPLRVAPVPISNARHTLPFGTDYETPRRLGDSPHRRSTLGLTPRLIDGGFSSRSGGLPSEFGSVEAAEDLSAGKDRNVRLAVRGADFTEAWFSAREVQMAARLSHLVHFAQQVWGRMLSLREEEWLDVANRPFLFDPAMALLMEQTARYMERSQAEHSLALHFELQQDGSGMHLHLRGLDDGRAIAASLTDNIDALELLTDALELRSVVRKALQRRL